MHPGARVDRVGGSFSGALVVRVRARAVDGAANESVTQLLGTAFGVSNSSVRCLRGHRSRRKFFSVEGDEKELAGQLDALLLLA